MTDKIKYLPHAVVTQLKEKEKIQENFPFYIDGVKKITDIVGGDAVKSATKAVIGENLAGKIQMPTEADTGDAHNSILVYESIAISPMHACDERIWVYLCHFDLHQYVSRRWEIPEGDDKKKANFIRTHYFVSDNRGLLRDNGVARLWWMGYIASRSKKFQDNPREALDILFLRSDVRANFLERNLSMNPDVFDAVVSLLKNDYEAELKKEENTIFNRQRFRNLMKSLNRIGGYKMLDVFDYRELYSEIERLAESA